MHVLYQAQTRDPLIQDAVRNIDEVNRVNPSFDLGTYNDPNELKTANRTKYVLINAKN